MVSKREKVAWAAAEAIEELGLEGTSLRVVASRTGATLGIVTHYFRNREDLLVATMEVVAESIMARVDRDSGDRLEAILSSVLPLDPASHTESSVWLAFAGLAARDRAVGDRFRAMYLEWESSVANELRSLGLGDDAVAVAGVLTAATDGIALRALASAMAPTHQLELLREAIDRCVQTAVN